MSVQPPPPQRGPFYYTHTAPPVRLLPPASTSKVAPVWAGWVQRLAGCAVWGVLLALVIPVGLAWWGWTTLRERLTTPTPTPTAVVATVTPAAPIVVVVTATPSNSGQWSVVSGQPTPSMSVDPQPRAVGCIGLAPCPGVPAVRPAPSATPRLTVAPAEQGIDDDWTWGDLLNPRPFRCSDGTLWQAISLSGYRVEGGRTREGKSTWEIIEDSGKRHTGCRREGN